MTKIYTKTGDKGTTGTLTGRMAKSDALAEALGAIDELNSWIGVCRHKTPLDAELRAIQHNLLTIGSAMAGSGLKVTSGETRKLEKLIDRLTAQLPKLGNFIFPIGELQVARSVARRAERKIVAAGVEDRQILKYVNRLSDALFTMARWMESKAGVAEEVWKG